VSYGTVVERLQRRTEFKEEAEDRNFYGRAINSKH